MDDTFSLDHPKNSAAGKRNRLVLLESTDPYYSLGTCNLMFRMHQSYLILRSAAKIQQGLETPPQAKAPSPGDLQDSFHIREPQQV